MKTKLAWLFTGSGTVHSLTITSGLALLAFTAAMFCGSIGMLNPFYILGLSFLLETVINGMTTHFEKDTAEDHKKALVLGVMKIVTMVFVMIAVVVIVGEDYGKIVKMSGRAAVPSLMIAVSLLFWSILTVWLVGSGISLISYSAPYLKMQGVKIRRLWLFSKKSGFLKTLRGKGKARGKKKIEDGLLDDLAAFLRDSD